MLSDFLFCVCVLKVLLGLELYVQQQFRSKHLHYYQQLVVTCPLIQLSTNVGSAI